jgi:signal peptidase I
MQIRSAATSSSSIRRPATGVQHAKFIAVGGDIVSMKGGDLHVNGQRLPRERVSSEAPARAAGQTPQGIIYQEYNRNTRYQIFLATGTPPDQLDFGEITIPEHHCFVLGDNRCESTDSRQFGPIPYAVIIGRANYIYWPGPDWSRFGRLE